MSDTTHTRRRTLPSALGEPMIWLTGGALVVCLAMIALLGSLVVVNGVRTFWPRPIELVTLDDGAEVLGIRVEHRGATRLAPERSLYRVGNRDIGQASFRWIESSRIVSRETPEDAVMLERESWGVWFGFPESILETNASGADRVVARGEDAVIEAFDEVHETARRRRAEAQRLRNKELGRINASFERVRLDRVEARIALERESPGRLAWWSWTAGALLALLSAGVWFRARRLGVGIGAAHTRTGRCVRFACLLTLLGTLAALWIGAPWRSASITPRVFERIGAHADAQESELQRRYDAVIERIRAIEREDQRDRIVVREPTTDRFAPIAQTEPDEPLLVSRVVRLVPANRLSLGEKIGVFVERWWGFLSARPREANTEGGVYPVIVGTVLMTLLLTLAVTPLGVIAALYLREYAKQGLVTSLIRIAVNNLAGVPSIVYGVFGLGFFCYTIGRYIDTGPTDALEMESWWGTFALSIGAAIGSYMCSLWGTPTPGRAPVWGHSLLRRLSWIGWGVTVVLLVVVVARTPYFFGFFGARAEAGSPTFGARGLLWASLTLALLTLPVVIVATEEAIAAVPDSMREGSYGCGASKWQTMRRVVLPGALPGILTGAILAMARGAGEVAPLMLVGAVKLNQDLPVSTEFPFLHADRSFMHLGFHIYDLGFQSPDSQAARPLVWTTTLLFLAIVLALNLAAILIRARIRGRMTGGSM